MLLWSMLPVSWRPALLVIIVVGVVFALSILGQPREHVPSYGPRAAVRMQSVCAAVQRSYRAAVNAEDVYQQLMYIHWAQAMLESLRTLAGDDTHLSRVVGVSITELRDQLKRGEEKCLALLK